MRTRWDIPKIATVVQVFIFEWPFSCRLRHHCQNSLVKRERHAKRETEYASHPLTLVHRLGLLVCSLCFRFFRQRKQQENSFKVENNSLWRKQTKWAFLPVIFLNSNCVPSAPLLVTFMTRFLVSPRTWLPNSTSVTSTEICLLRGKVKISSNLKGEENFGCELPEGSGYRAD